MQYPTIAQPQYGFAPTMLMMPSMSDMPPAMMANGGSVADAQSVQSKGRGRDTMLVHMTPKEVGGLQALAMQQGGSLTINPQTGLPEAGFLENLLPTLLGVGLSFIPGVGPLAAAGITTAIQTARTGDLGQGLLAGLGAYGGASLGAGLSSAGAAGAGAGATGAGAAGGVQFATTPAEIAAATGTEVAATSAGAAGAGTAAPIYPTTLGDTGAAIFGGPPSSAMEAANLAVDPMAVPGNSARVLAPPSATPPTPTFSSNFAQAGRGVESIFEPGGFDKFIGNPAVTADPSKGIVAAPATGLGGGFGAAKTAAFAAAPALLAPPPAYEPPGEEESDYEGPYTPSERRVSYPGDDERRRSSEFTYFNPSNPIPFAEGGETAGLGALGDSISPSEARVYQNIANVQRLAGLPAIDPSQFSVAPSKGYERFVYNPIEAGPTGSGVGPEKDYGFAPLMSREEAEAAAKARAAAAAAAALAGSMGFAVGGRVSVPTLENGGFVLTKKAVDGLGRGNNEKGQANAQRGLGAIPIRGAGAKRGPKAGVDDKIRTSIDGKRPALVSNGEAYVPKKQVARKGGAKAFYALMKQAEKSADKRRRA